MSSGIIAWAKIKCLGLVGVEIVLEILPKIILGCQCIMTSLISEFLIIDSQPCEWH